LFGSDLNLRGSGGPGLGNPASSGPFFDADPPSLPVLVWVVMVLGLLGPLVSWAMVLALPVLASLALVVLEMASLISVSDPRANGEAGRRVSVFKIDAPAGDGLSCVGQDVSGHPASG